MFLLLPIPNVLQEKPESFSVHGLETRTTSSVEAYNGAIGRRILSNCSFYKFMRYLIDEEFVKAKEFEQLLDSGGATAKKKKGFFAVSVYQSDRNTSKIPEKYYCQT